MDAECCLQTAQGLSPPGDSITVMTHGSGPLPRPEADSAHTQKVGTATMTAARECGNSLETATSGMEVKGVIGNDGSQINGAFMHHLLLAFLNHS